MYRSVRIKSVNIGAILNFIMDHNQLVFGVTLAIVLALCAFLLYRIYFSQDAAVDVSSGSQSGAEIEATLKKILSQTSGLAPAAPGATAASGDVSVAPVGAAALSPEHIVEVEKLRKEVAANQALVAELKSKAANPSTQFAADQTAELLAKIKILEDRLLEYEIIEDDIADLSLYKEENAKLKRELEALRGGPTEVLKNEEAVAAVDVAAGVAPAEAVAAAAAPTPPDAAVEPKPSEKPSEEVSAPPPAESVPPVDPGQVATDVSRPADAPAAAPAGDVFAEFQGQDSTDALAGLGDLDADKMLEEIKDLGEGGGTDSAVLEEAVDLEKMAKEAAQKGDS